MYAHGLACLRYALRQLVVVAAGPGVSAWVVVGYGYDGGVLLYCVFHYYPHVDCRLRYSAMRQAYGVDVLVCLIHQYQVCFFNVKITHQWPQMCVKALRIIQYITLWHFLHLSSPSQFTRCHYSYGFGLTYTVVTCQLVKCTFAQHR